MKQAVQQILTVAGGVLIAAAFYEAVRATEPPMMWPLSLGFAALCLVGAAAIKSQSDP